MISPQARSCCSHLPGYIHTKPFSDRCSAKKSTHFMVSITTVVVLAVSNYQHNSKSFVSEIKGCFSSSPLTDYFNFAFKSIRGVVGVVRRSLCTLKVYFLPTNALTCNIVARERCWLCRFPPTGNNIQPNW